MNAPLPTRLLLVVFLPFATGFFLSFLFRNVNAVISKDIAGTFSLTSAELGLLTSAYFIAFATTQIPLGIFLDRYGPRRVTASLLLVAAAGAAAFAAADGLGSLVFGRVLIGLGVSACLMGSMKAFTLWFPLDRLATLNGWVIAAGALGAVAATVPVEFAASVVGWRGIFAGLAGFSVLVSAWIFFAVPEKPLAGAHERWDEQWSKICAIFATPAFWRIGAPLILIQGSYQSLFGLWLVPWLMDTQGLARGEAAQWLMWSALTYAVASVIFGQGADRMAARGFSRMTLMKWGTLLSVAGFFGLAFAPGLLKLPLLLTYAFGSLATMLAYAILSRHFSVAVSGRLNTALNVSTFVFAFIAQIGTGMMLRVYPAEGGRYPPESYALAFAVLGAVQLAAWLLVATMKREPEPWRAPG